MMNKVDFLLIISSLALIFSIIGTILGLVAMIKVIAAEKSTHSVTYMPIDEEIDKANQETAKNWATQESMVAKDREMFQEELESELPDFYPSDEDKEIISF